MGRKNLIEIDYVKLENDMILVKEVRNLLSPKDISGIYGSRVLYYYRESDCFVYQGIGGAEIRSRDSEGVVTQITLITPGVTGRKAFSDTINLLKQAGANLIKSINKARSDDAKIEKHKPYSDVRTVVI